MRKVIALGLFLLISLTGLCGGTAWNVRDVHPRDRGLPLMRVQGYPIYNPSRVFWWWVLADEHAMVTMLPGVGISVGSMVIGALVVRVVGIRGAVNPRERYISGARWATREDLKRGKLL